MIDANALLQVANSGLGQVADTTISPVCPMWDGISENATKTVDVEKAKQLLAEAGYADGVSVTCRATSTTAELTMIQEQLRAGGIEMNIEMAEMPVHFRRWAPVIMICTFLPSSVHTTLKQYVQQMVWTIALRMF